ncbi:MAG: hypothetical protein LBG22_05990, partial [Treponema sp.]|nr:hypothetical protein [Treponema sp.]
GLLGHHHGDLQPGRSLKALQFHSRTPFAVTLKGSKNSQAQQACSKGFFRTSPLLPYFTVFWYYAESRAFPKS